MVIIILSPRLQVLPEAGSVRRTPSVRLVPEGVRLEAGTKPSTPLSQLDEEAALGHAGDGALVALAQMAAGILGLIAVLSLPLDLHGDDSRSLDCLEVALCEIGVAEDYGLLLGTLEHIGHDAMDGQVGGNGG